MCICGIKILGFNETDILTHLNFGSHDIPWLQVVKKTYVNLDPFFLNIMLKHTMDYVLEIA